MAADKVRVFISSSMSELAAERRAVHTVLQKDRIFEPFAWEADAGARPSSAREAWREELSEAHVCIVILWHKLGQWTRDEIATAMELDLSLLVYVKLDPDGTVDPDVQAFLQDLEDPATGEFVSGRFDTTDRLRKLVTTDLARVLADTMSDKRERNVSSREAVTGSGRRLVAAPQERGWDATEAAPKKAGRRPVEELGRLPRSRGTFVNRSDEVAKTQRAIVGDDHAVALTGASGMGKKALLGRLATQERFEGRFPDGAGVHPEQADCDDVEDLVQAIWEEFYVPEELGQVEPRQRLRQLRTIDALVYLLDLDLAPEAIEELVDAVPNATFCFSYVGSGRPPAKTVRLAGLADPEHLVELFESRYQADVPEPARADVVALCQRVDGSPARVMALADLAWTEAEDTGGPADATHPLVAWATRHAALAPEELVRRLVSPDAAPPVVVAAAVGVPVPHDILAAVTSTSGVDEGVAERVLVPGSPRYRLNPAVADEYRPAPEETDAVLAPVFDATPAWVRAATPERLYDDRAFVLRMLGWGVEQGRHAEVLEIARVAEPALALGGRWGAWEQVLQLALEAGRAGRDEHAEAWALHQLGARALVADELGDARVYLHHALEKRDRLGDTEAAAVTRQTLANVPLAVMSGAALVAFVLALLGWFVLLADPTPAWQTTVVAALDVDPELLTVGGPGSTATITIRNVSGGAVRISAGPSDRVVANDCQDVAPDESCSVVVRTDDEGSVTFSAKDTRAGGGPLGGDQTVFVVPASS